MDKKSFRKLFVELKKDTNNFKLINRELFGKNPRYIRVFRAICNLNHLKLTEIYSRKFNKTVRFGGYESGAMNVGRKVSNRLIKIFKENFPREINYELIEKAFLNSQQYNEPRHKLGKKLESLVRESLLDHKIEFSKNVNIKGASGIPINVDFVIPSRNLPKIAIECKATKDIAGHYSISIARGLAINSVELRSKNIKFIAFLGGRWTTNSIKLLENYCEIMRKNELDDLPNLIKRLEKESI